MVEAVFVSVFDRFCGPVVSLKSYGQYNNQTLQPEQQSKECTSVLDVPEFLDREDNGGLFATSTAAYSKAFKTKSLKKIGNKIVPSCTLITPSFHKPSVKNLIVIIMQAKTVQAICMSSL